MTINRYSVRCYCDMNHIDIYAKFINSKELYNVTNWCETMDA